MITNTDGKFDDVLITMARTLYNKGYEKMMISKLIFYLKPNSLEKALEYVTIKNGKWGHPMLIKGEDSGEFNNQNCEICRGSKIEHNRIINLDKTCSFDNMDSSVANLMNNHLNNSYSNILNFDTSFCEDSSVVNKLFDDITVENIEEQKLKNLGKKETNNINVIPFNNKKSSDLPIKRQKSGEYISLNVSSKKPSNTYEREYELRPSFQDMIQLPSSSENFSNFHFTPGYSSGAGGTFNQINNGNTSVLISDNNEDKGKYNTTRYNFERPSWGVNSGVNESNFNPTMGPSPRLPISRKKKRHSNYINPDNEKQTEKEEGYKNKGHNYYSYNNVNHTIPSNLNTADHPNITITNSPSPKNKTVQRSKSKLDYFGHIKMKNFQSELSELESDEEINFKETKHNTNNPNNIYSNNIHYSHHHAHKYRSKKTRVSKLSKVSRMTRANKSLHNNNINKQLRRTKTEKSFKSFRSIKSINKNIVNLNLNIHNSRSLQCNNCFISAPSGGNNNYNPIKILECKHSMCVKCIKEILHDKTETNKFDEICCIECGQAFTKKLVSKYLDDFQLIQYLKYCKKINNYNNELIRCPLSNCNGYALNPAYTQQLSRKTELFNTMAEKFNNNIISPPHKSYRENTKGTVIKKEKNAEGKKTSRYLTIHDNINRDRVTLDSINPNFSYLQKYFIKCENDHNFCYMCKKEAHYDSVCENIKNNKDAVEFKKGILRNSTNNPQVSLRHLPASQSQIISSGRLYNDSNSFNQILQVNSHKFIKKCPNCDYLCEKIKDLNPISDQSISKNIYKCVSCKYSFCFFCSKILNKYEIYTHYYNPFNFCFFMSNASPDSLYLKNSFIKFLRYIVFLLFSIILIYPLYFLFSSFILLWYYNHYFYGDIIKLKLMVRIYNQYNSSKTGGLTSFSYYITLVIPRLMLLLSAIYLYPFFIILNILSLVGLILFPFAYFLNYTYRKISK